MDIFNDKLRRLPLRFHGNGFIQVFLNESGSHRLHIWHPDYPPLADHNATIHDHLFDMDSSVLLGKIEHKTYVPVDRPLTGMITAAPGYDVYEVDVKTGVLDLYGHCDFKLTGTNIMSAGSRYLFPAGQYHDTPHNGSLAITHFVKTPNITNRGPRVACPHGSIPTDAFDPTRAPEKHELLEAAYGALRELPAAVVRDAYGLAARRP